MMQRRHESRYYSSEGLRHLQRQINELWEHFEALRQAHVKSGGTGTGPVPVDPEAGPDIATVDRRVEDMEEPRTLTPEEIGNMTGITEVMTGHQPPALNPQSFKVIPTGRGWYQVVDSEGKPIHEGKLRAKPAYDRLQEAMGAV